MNKFIPKSVTMKDIKEDIKLAVKYLKNRRLEFGWSIAELSKRSGVSVGVISDLENDKGKIPSVANFIALARTLKMTEEHALALIIDYRTNYTPGQFHVSPEALMIDSIREYGVYDEDALDFIVNTINFFRRDRLKKSKINKRNVEK